MATLQEDEEGDPKSMSATAETKPKITEDKRDSSASQLQSVRQGSGAQQELEAHFGCSGCEF